MKTYGASLALATNEIFSLPPAWKVVLSGCSLRGNFYCVVLFSITAYPLCPLPRTPGPSLPPTRRECALSQAQRRPPARGDCGPGSRSREAADVPSGSSHLPARVR